MLVFKYLAGLTPVILIIVYTVFSELFRFREEIYYIMGIVVVFSVLGLVKEMYFMLSRVISFISPFAIVIASDFGKSPRRVVVLTIASCLMAIPVVPSYFYSDMIDRPYYPIPKDCLAIIHNEDFECINSSDILFRYLLKVYGKDSDMNKLTLMRYNEDIEITRGYDKIFITKIKTIQK